MERPSRNDLCPCGSGRKYKRCCLGREAERLAFADSLEAVALPLLRRLARFAEASAEVGLEGVARAEFPFWQGEVDRSQAARIVDFLMFDYRPRHFGRRTAEQFAIEVGPSLDAAAQTLLGAWVDAPRRLVEAGRWSAGFTTCVDLLDENAARFDVFDIEGSWRPGDGRPFAVRPLAVGEHCICTGTPVGFGGRASAEVADAMRRRHLDFVRMQRIAPLGEFLRTNPTALDEESVTRPSSSTIVLPGVR